MLMRVIAGPDGWVHTLIEQDAPKGWQPPAEPYGAVIAARPEIELPLLEGHVGELPQRPGHRPLHG